MDDRHRGLCHADELARIPQRFRCSSNRICFATSCGESEADRLRGRSPDTFEQSLLSVRLCFSRLSVVPDIDSLDKEQDILGDVGGMVGNAFQVVRNKH